jgi:ABC-type transport system involved in multi-copper enzyme maturation permease subunit
VYCDRLLFLAPGGRLAFSGTLTEALDHFAVERVERIYELLAEEREADEWTQRFAADPQPVPEAAFALRTQDSVSFAQQCSILTRRTLETLVRSPLTMTILLGCPAAIVAMFAMLFRGGAFDSAHASPSIITMILFWIAFAGYFFGLTYGLLQVVTEQAIVRRERFAGQNLAAYLCSKVAVLVPFLLFVVVLTLVVLRASDRLPPVGLGQYAAATTTLVLEACGALALGLLTSAAVRTPAQATLALPMLCFPAVLFSGAILPVHVMAWPGAWLSAIVPVRWAFEAVGQNFGAWDLLRAGPAGGAFSDDFGRVGMHTLALYWSLLTAFVITLLIAAWAVLRSRYRPGV